MKTNEKTKLTIAWLIFAVGVIAFLPFVNAEEVDVPFESQSTGCFEESTFTEQTYTCVFTAKKAFGIRVIQTGLDELDRAVLEGIDYAKKMGTYIRPPEQCWENCDGVTEDDAEFEDERAIKKLICSQHKLDPSDVELCRLLDQLALCNQGYGRLAPVQKVRSFVVTIEDPDDFKQWDLKRNSYLGKALKAYEECRATKTEHGNLSEEYANKIVDDIYNNYLYHADKATTDDTFPTQRLTQYSYDRSIVDAMSTICFSDNGFSLAFKKQMGCVNNYDREFKNLTGGVAVKGKSAEILADYWDCKDNDNCTIDMKGNYIIIRECGNSSNDECNIVVETKR